VAQEVAFDFELGLALSWFVVLLLLRLHCVVRFEFLQALWVEDWSCFSSAVSQI